MINQLINVGAKQIKHHNMIIPLTKTNQSITKSNLMKSNLI